MNRCHFCRCSSRLHLSVHSLTYSGNPSLLHHFLPFATRWRCNAPSSHTGCISRPNSQLGYPIPLPSFSIPFPYMDPAQTVRFSMYRSPLALFNGLLSIQPRSSCASSTATSPDPPYKLTNDDIEAVIQMATTARPAPDGRPVPPRDTRTQLFVGNVCARPCHYYLYEAQWPIFLVTL